MDGYDLKPTKMPHPGLCTYCGGPIEVGAPVLGWSLEGDPETGPMGPFFDHEACGRRAAAENEQLAAAFEAYGADHVAEVGPF